MDITKDLNVLSFTIYLHQFVDLCILLGCDYCDKIAGLGPKRALTLIKKHRTIENVVLHVNRKVPDGQPVFFFSCACVLHYKKNMYSLIRHMYLLPPRHIQCHNSGSTKKHGKYSWIRHRRSRLNSTGMNQMKKPWLGSSVVSNMSSTYCCA